MSHTQINYRTFDELLSEASMDLHMYDVEGMIEPATLIKVAQAINFRLGARITQTKEAVVDIENNKGRLPEGFDILNYALLCLGSRTVTFIDDIGGGTREDVDASTTLGELCANDNKAVYSCKGSFENCGRDFIVVETRKRKTRVYDDFRQVRVKPGKLVSKECAVLSPRTGAKIELRDGFVFTEFDCGKLYLNFLGKMQDEEGNLLVLDHPLVNEYYEYAIKERILENLYLNGEEVTRKLELVQAKLKNAKTESMSFVNTPDYAELKQIHDLNRKAMYQKYYSMFAS